MSKVVSGWSGCASCRSSGPAGAIVVWSVGAAAVAGAVGATRIGSSGALMSPEIGGIAASNSGSGTIGLSPRGSVPAGASLTSLGTSGPLAGAVPGWFICASAVAGVIASAIANQCDPLLTRRNANPFFRRGARRLVDPRSAANA